METLTKGLIDNSTLLSMLKQQTDELDAIENCINLTSILDLPDVLDAVVREAMRFIKCT